jgi:hypothetical protein
MVVHLVLMLITSTLIDEPLSCLVSHLHHCVFNTVCMTTKVSKLLLLRYSIFSMINDMNKFAIVLTGTITPNSIRTTHVDTMMRRQEYLNAVKFYTKFAPVFFLENSCYSLDQDKEFSEIQNHQENSCISLSRERKRLSRI